jgi:hypothetical protein
MHEIGEDVDVEYTQMHERMHKIFEFDICLLLGQNQFARNLLAPRVLDKSDWLPGCALFHNGECCVFECILPFHDMSNFHGTGLSQQGS